MKPHGPNGIYKNDGSAGAASPDNDGPIGGYRPLETWNGGPGNDTHVGTSGDDVLSGYGGDDTLDGGGGNDTIYGGDDNDTLSGGAGDDVLDAGTGNNTLDGGEGNDRLYSHGGIDHVDGGTGLNYWYGDYSTSTGSLTFDSAAGTLSNGTTLANLSQIAITTGYGDDTFNVVGTAYFLNGGSGYNVLSMDFGHLNGGAKFSIQESDKLGLYGYFFAGYTFSHMSEVHLTASDQSDRITVGSLSSDQFALISVDGGAGVNKLIVSFAACDSTKFVLEGGGVIKTNHGVFANFDQIHISVGGGHNDVELGSAKDIIYADQGGTNFLDGGGGDDRIYAEYGGDNTINGGKGDDLISTGGTGTDVLSGGDGDDVITTNLAASATVDGGAGEDTWIGTASSGSFVFDDAAGTLTNTDGTSTTTLSNLETYSLANYQSSTATYNLSTAGNVRVLADASVAGSVINVDLSDSDQSFTVNGAISTIAQLTFGQTVADADVYTQVNVIGSSVGDQFIIASRYIEELGGFSLDGGGGDDALVIDFSATSGVTFVVADDGSITSNRGSFAHLEQFTVTVGNGDNVVTTGNYADVITVNAVGGGHNTLDGGGGNDTISGGKGDDLLRGSAGDDLLQGNGGNDVLNGGDGNDILDGGDGNDTASYRGAEAGVHVAIVAGQQDTIGAGLDLLSSIENLTGSSFNDKLTGDGNANILIGASGDDKLIGGAGNDVLEGDSGKDQMTGGAGADRFVFAALTDFDPKGHDKITDFSHTDGDTIDLSAIDPDPKAAGDQSFTFIGGAAFAKGGTDYELRVVDKGGGNYVVQGDVNHDGHADFSFMVHAAAPLVATDFHL